MTKKNKFTLLLWPISFTIILFDILRGKVEKTHIEFDKNKKDYKLIKKVNFKT